MKKIGIIEVSDIDKDGDFKIQIPDCSYCGYSQGFYFSSEEAYYLMYHLKKELLKND